MIVRQVAAATQAAHVARIRPLRLDLAQKTLIALQGNAARILDGAVTGSMHLELAMGAMVGALGRVFRVFHELGRGTILARATLECHSRHSSLDAVVVLGWTVNNFQSIVSRRSSGLYFCRRRRVLP